MTWRVTIPLDPMGKPAWKSKQMGKGITWLKTAAEHMALARPPRIPRGVPVRCAIVSIKARPKRLAKAAPGLIPCPVKPDADNVSKIVKDAATRAGVWADDDQVVDLRVLTFYAEVDGAPRVISSVSPETAQRRPSKRLRTIAWVIAWHRLQAVKARGAAALL